MSRMSLIRGAALLAAFMTVSCASQPGKSPVSAERSLELSDASHILGQLTLEEKVSQLFIIPPDQLSVDSRTRASKKLVRQLSSCPVGGFIFFARNIETPEQVRAFTDRLQAAAPIPLLMAIDEEGGRVARLARSERFFLPRFKNMETVGKSADRENARGAGQIIGAYLSTFGFDLDFAPVVDVNTNPENIVIGRRAFGSEPDLVGDMAAAFLSGLHSTGVKGCIKHFPGHGDTKGDTHADYVAVTKSWEELQACELIPFVRNLQAADCVMIAHVTCTAVDTEYPASLSRKLITEKLRNELGYQGVILTDALNMGAIEKNYGSGQACLLALEAGNDMLLMPADFPAAYEAMLAAVKSGRISQQRLDESLLRILHLKGF